jgi:hypothetical protein
MGEAGAGHGLSAIIAAGTARPIADCLSKVKISEPIASGFNDDSRNSLETQPKPFFIESEIGPPRAFYTISVSDNQGHRHDCHCKSFIECDSRDLTHRCF